MRLLLILFIIVGGAVADHNYAWETGNEYQFLIRSRTLTALDNLAQQFSGILLKGVLTVQVRSPDTLHGTITNPQSAPVHKLLSEGWDSKIPDEMLELHELPLSGKSFEIRTENGVIRDLLVDQNVPTWEVNFLKSVVSQLQIDTQGENAITSKSMQIPDDEQPFAMFRAMEESVGGKCEVLYDITPLPEDVRLKKPELIPLPDLGNGNYLDITKTKNYSRCEQRMDYHFSMGGKTNWKPGSHDGLLSISSTSRIVISGKLKHFTIQSSATTNKIFLKPGTYDSYAGTVYSRMNLTLHSANKISNPMAVSDNLISVGNLVYTYKDIDNMPDREERDCSELKLSLDEVSNPLSHFIGYGDKSAEEFEKNITMEAAQLIQQIAKGIIFVPLFGIFEPLSYPVVLDKYTILTKLIRIMNSKQIAEMEDFTSAIWSGRVARSTQFLHSTGKADSIELVREILRDAVAQAGTGPALITIANWIKNKKLEGTEAARIISKIPKVARVPTPEYVQMFFELITDPEVSKQSFLNVSAPLAFAELVRYTQVSPQNRYPVYNFAGCMMSKHERELRENNTLKIYIPYMAEQLREAFKEGDSPRIQTYIIALGNFGHPKILSVFEPYLEGTQPASKFQRLTMVIALAKLAQTNPRLARSVLYKIYLNVMDAHEVRCVAVYLLMVTNPPLAMLQRMAEFTNHDESRHVNSAVKSIIESLANLKLPEQQDLASKARIARKLLSSQSYGDKYSKGLIENMIIDSIDTIYKLILHTIGGDSIIPEAAYFAADVSHAGFNLPTMEIGYVMSNIRQFLRMWDQTEQKDKRLIVEKYLRQLGIQPNDELEQFEGHVLINGMFGSQFYPFDDHITESITKKLLQYLQPSKKSKRLELRDIHHMDSYDVTLGFPIESGLPFVYTLKMSKFARFGAGGEYSINAFEGFATDANVTGDIMMIEKIESRTSFVTPFENRHYIAGVESNLQIFLPISFRVKWKPAMKNFQLKIYSLDSLGFERATYHHSVIPYTARHDILNLEPVIVDNNTQIVHTKEPHEVTAIIADHILVKAKSDNFDNEIEIHERKNLEAYKEIAKFWHGHDSRYKLIDVSMLTVAGKINVTYDIKETDTDGSEHQQSWPTNATAPEVTDKQSNSVARRKQFLDEVGKDINSATAYVFDMDIDFPPIRQALTVGVASSNVDEKSRGLFYWNLQPQTIKDIDDIYLEVRAAGQMRSSQEILLDFEKAIERVPQNEFDVDLRFGSGGSDGEKIGLKGYLMRSDDLKEMIMKSEIAKQCQQEMRQGNKGLRACQKATKLAGWSDHLRILLDIESKLLKSLFIDSIPSISKNSIFSRTVMETINPWNPFTKDTIDIDVKMLPNDKSRITFYTPHYTMYTTTAFSMNGVLESTSVNVDNEENVLEKEEEEAEEEEENVSCTIDKTHAVTFDDKVYPLELGHCWHVMMIIYPQQSLDNSNSFNILEERSVAVTIGEMDDGSRKVEMILGDKNVQLMKSDDHLRAMVNKEYVEFSQHTSYRDKQENETVVEIFELPDGSIRVISEKYEVNAVYDGERIRLEVSDEYGSAVRGLCGNFDSRPDNDFIIPKNCILTKPEEFSAMYALNDSCSKSETKFAMIKQTAEQSECVPIHSYRYSNVISDKEAGRL